MAYVDLNPIRAKITEKLEESNNTSIKKRLKTLKDVNPIDAQKHLDTSISAMTTQNRERMLPMNLKDYIELVEWTGKSIIHPNKASIPPHISSSLQRLNLQQNHWLKQIENFGQNYCHVVGPIEQIKAKAKQLKLRCMKGTSAAKLLFE